MTNSNECVSIITDTSLRGFFQASITEAMQRQRVVADDLTVVYLVNMLQSFLRSEDFYADTVDGPALQPLALVYAEAVNAGSDHQRDTALRRLGDLALFVAGVFAESLNRRPVDIDYYVGMGGNAYGCLAESRVQQRGQRGALAGVFAELARQFVAFVDVLATVHERIRLRSDRDVLRVYETWLRTGSERAAGLLRQAGIEPIAAPVRCQ